ncbi:MAG: histidine kinase [Chromatiales bacterium 21-64-14]|nr:MAG: histidine kinase [Chromatiales bacterium 21-64-14]HQU16549.1 HDOD domain-containing protein [Gammaproteobacteria bacterium]
MSAQAQFLSDLLQELDQGRFELPTLPEVALKVRDAVSSGTCTAKQTASMIATDAALSARLIQVVNSPLYRASKPIDNLPMAVSRLGNSMVRNLVTSLVMKQMFQATTDFLDRRLRALWEHNVQVAAISRMLATQFTRLPPDQAMLAGLLHDVGALPILKRAEDSPQLLGDMITLDRLIDEHHPRIGEKILAAWEFPPALVAVAAHHEDLKRDPGTEPDLVDVVIVANLQSYFGTNHRHSQVDWSQIPAFRRLGISTDVSVVEVEAHEEQIQAVQRMFDI